MKVSDILPKVSLAREQRVNFYAAPGGALLRSAPRNIVESDPRSAAGKGLWECEVAYIDASSPKAFNLTVQLPEGRTHI